MLQDFYDKPHKSFVQLCSYFFIGLLSNLLGYFLYLSLTYFGLTPKVTMTMLYLIGVVINFIGNYKFTFQYQGKLFGLMLRFFISHCFGYLINLIILIIFVDKLGYAHQLVQMFAIFTVAIFLFILFKFFVFSDMPEMRRLKKIRNLYCGLKSTIF